MALHLVCHKIRTQSQMYLLEFMNFFLIPPNVVVSEILKVTRKDTRATKCADLSFGF